MIVVDIRHAALFGISKGWYLNAPEFRGYPFTPAEWAVAAATPMYLSSMQSSKEPTALVWNTGVL